MRVLAKKEDAGDIDVEHTTEVGNVVVDDVGEVALITSVVEQQIGDDALPAEIGEGTFDLLLVGHVERRRDRLGGSRHS